MWCHIWLLALLRQGPKIPTTFPNKAVNELGWQKGYVLGCRYGRFGNDHIVYWHDRRVWGQTKWFSAIKSLCLHRGNLWKRISRNEEAEEVLFSWAEGEFHVPVSQDPTNKTTESTCGGSTRSNHRKKNIYTLTSSFHLQEVFREGNTWDSGGAGTWGRAQGNSIPQSQTGNSLTTQGKSTGEQQKGLDMFRGLSGPWSQGKLHHHSSWQCIWVMNAGSDPTILSAQTNFFHNPKWIPFQTRFKQQQISCLRYKRAASLETHKT